MIRWKCLSYPGSPGELSSDQAIRENKNNTGKIIPCLNSPSGVKLHEESNPPSLRTRSGRASIAIRQFPLPSLISLHYYHIIISIIIIIIPVLIVRYFAISNKSPRFSRMKLHAIACEKSVNFYSSCVVLVSRAKTSIPPSPPASVRFSPSLQGTDLETRKGKAGVSPWAIPIVGNLLTTFLHQPQHFASLPFARFPFFMLYLCTRRP